MTTVFHIKIPSQIGGLCLLALISLTIVMDRYREHPEKEITSLEKC